MITKTIPVYWCGFCKTKRGLSKYAMEKHEKHCTANPGRECRLCKLHNLRKEDCPICEFSNMRLTHQFPENYNYQETMKQFWETINSEQEIEA